MLVADRFNAELKKASKAGSNVRCEHFAYSRPEVFQIVKVRGIKTQNDHVASHGKGHECEARDRAAGVNAVLASRQTGNKTNTGVLQPT